MQRVTTAIEGGRCVFAVSGSLMNDADVVLALKERAHGVSAIALSGLAHAPITPPTEQAVARCTQQPGGVLVIVNPQSQDDQGLKKIAEMVAKAPHKPTILVAAQQFNPLQFAMVFRGQTVGHLKSRGKEFFKGLPVPPSLDSPDAAKKPKASEDGAPRFVFTGREEELATLTDMLKAPGPIVVSGPAGIGKTLLTEHAVTASGLTRLPDLVLGWGTDADALIARLAEICRHNGSTALYDVAKAGAAPTILVDVAVAALKEAAGTEDKVLVIHDLHIALGRDDGFFRKSRLEMLLIALLTNTYPLRIVFLSRGQPIFHRERLAEHLRRVPLAGIKGRFFHDIFEAYKAPEFPRDKFGPMSDRLFGHPMVARAFAIEVRDRENGVALLEDDKFLRMESVGDLASYKKLIERKVEKLPEDEKRALLLAAHFRLPVTGLILAEAGIARKARLQLLAHGLLETVGTEKDRRFVVHSLVRSALSIRETTDFDILANLAEGYGKLSRDATDPIQKLAYAQEANRNAILGRASRLKIALDLPDDDAMLEMIAGVIRGKKPNIDVGADRVAEVLKANPMNSDAHLLKLEMMDRAEAPKEAIDRAIEDAIATAPVPELYQQLAGMFSFRKARTRAIALLEQGISALPDESRLRTRLAALLVRQGRRKEAIEHLKAAMEQDPMLPDAYGLLGQAKREEGADSLGEAEGFLREAVRLAPDDSTQVCRLVDLLLVLGRSSSDRQVSARAEAKEHLDRLLKNDRPTAEAHLLYAQLLREEGGDLERALWMIKKAKKLTEHKSERNSRIGLEFALLAIKRGDLDQAEAELRELANRDGANDRIFAGLAQVLEARQNFIPAHAELLRAQERTPQGSPERATYDAELARLQALIEAQAANVIAGDSLPALPEPEVDANAAGHQRVIRRRKAADGEPETTTPEDAA